MPRFTVAIVGGGLCGLVLALALEKYAPDVDYQIYEAVAELTTAGAGIGVPPRTLFVLRELGLESALLKIAGNGEKDRLNILFRKSDQKEGYAFIDPTPDSTELQWTFHRGELQKLFLDHICYPERIHMGKRLASYTQSVGPNGRVELRFHDGSTAACDVMLGADGIKSQVRATMYTQLANAAQNAGRAEEAVSLRSHINAVFSGSSVYRGLLEREAVVDDAKSSSNMLINIAMYPISQGRILNVAASITNPELEGTVYEGPWTTEVSREEVRREYVGWESEVEEVVQQIGSWNKWAINVVKDLPTFVDTRVALLGDAAHSMTPFQGAGAGQGFEDTLMLGILFGQSVVTKDSIPAALRIYDQFRRFFAQKVAALSMQSGLMQSLIYPELDAAIAAGRASVTEEEYLARIAENIERLKEWRRGTDVMEDCLSAVRLLRDTISGE
ncbi:Salicylate hydroxylase [Trametes pubescens]|uniref:Salicylate hydroxylase n=1 Tax=Trametes pubescens TaxID=154538 RepID=A0A1M2VA55_TRAPU|nr:Salicylate hydroxylase [Trametes pubescens]